MELNLASAVVARPQLSWISVRVLDYIVIYASVISRLNWRQFFVGCGRRQTCQISENLRGLAKYSSVLEVVEVFMVAVIILLLVYVVSASSYFVRSALFPIFGIHVKCVHDF